MLRSGANDLGGTLMEETISRMAGSSYGSYRSVKDLVAIADAMRPPGQTPHHPLRRGAGGTAAGRGGIGRSPSAAASAGGGVGGGVGQGRAGTGRGEPGRGEPLGF